MRSKYYIGASDSMIGSSLKSGLTEVEEPFGEGQSGFDYGQALDVSRDVLTHNPISEGSFPEDASTKGGFTIERYIRLIDKENTENVPDFIVNRPDNLRGVVNIQEFIDFLRINESSWADEDGTKYLSDWFGDAAVSEDGTSLSGTIGVKFGARLTMIPPDSFSPLGSNTGALAVKAQQEKAYMLKKADNAGPGTKHLFPLASYEADILDRPIEELNLDDPNMGEDLKCYVDALTKTDEFSLIFDACLPLTRISSLVAVYSYYGFLASIGEDTSERDFDKWSGFREPDDSAWKEGFFEDTKNIAYRMFKSIYKTNDFEDADDDKDWNLESFLKEIMPALFTNLDPSTAWWQRWRIKSRPFNKDGKSCLGEFGSLISPE